MERRCAQRGIAPNHLDRIRLMRHRNLHALNQQQKQLVDGSLIWVHTQFPAHGKVPLHRPRRSSQTQVGRVLS